MMVTAIFDRQYEGELAGSVWILDTTPNRSRFEASTGLDPNSALISTNNDDTPRTAPVEVIWSIMDHYPEVEKIVVIGVGHEASIAEALKEDCDTEATTEGFICWRANGTKSA